MRRFKNILFVDLSDQDMQPALRRTAKLAATNEANLAVLGVVPEPSRFDQITRRGSCTLPEVIAEHTHRQLVDQVKRLRSKQPVKIDVAVGVPFISIIERVLAADHDLLVITDDGPDSPNASTAKHLLRKCPCPVWVMRPSKARRQRILAAIDVQGDAEPSNLNRLILDLATSQVHLTDADLHIAHAWTLYGESTLQNSAFLRVKPGELERLLNDARDDSQLSLDRTLSAYSLDNTDAHVHLVKGPPGDAILKLANKYRITLLVMGTVGRTGVPGLIVGSTAERILDHVNCSILAVKPEGFVSPVSGGRNRPTLFRRRKS